MLSGEPYQLSDREISVEQAAAQGWLVRHKHSERREPADWRRLRAERLAAVADGAAIRPPFHCDAGFNSSLGKEAAIVRAGSVVTHHVPDGATVIGNPAPALRRGV